MATEFEIEVVGPEKQNNVVATNSPNEALNQAFEQLDELSQEEETHIRWWIVAWVHRKCTDFFSLVTFIVGIWGFFTDIRYGIVLSAEELPPRPRNVLLLLFLSMVRFLVEMLSGQLDIDSKFVNSSEPTVLSMREALTKFYIEMAYMMVIVLLYLMILLLVRPQPPILQIFLMLIWICAPIFYVPEMVDKASRVGVSVTWGSLKLSFLEFTASGAVILSLIFVPLLLTLLYLIGGRNRGERNEG